MRRKIKSVKIELIKKAREAMLAAVQVYNNPQITFKSEAFITLAIIAWTYLLHAYYRGINIDYRYRKQGKKREYEKTKYGAYRHWDLSACIEEKTCPLDGETKANLFFLIGIRNEVEHQMTSRIDEYISAKLQACAINFDYYICLLFGDKYNLSKELSLAIQFSPLSPEQTNDLRYNTHITSNIRNFIVEYEDILSDEALKSSRYAYRVLFVPINAKRPGHEDRVVEFISSNSPLAEGLEKQYAVLKEIEKPKYLPGEVVKLMKSKGYTSFTMNTHTMLWKSKDARNPKYSYGTKVANTWYWYESWVKIVADYCAEHKDELAV